MATVVLGVISRQKNVQRKQRDHLSDISLWVRKPSPGSFPFYTSLILMGQRRVSGLFKPITDKWNDWIIIRIYLWAENYTTFLLFAYLNKFMALLVRVLIMSVGEPTYHICYVWFSKCDLWVSHITCQNPNSFPSILNLLNRSSVGGAQPSVF